MGIKLHERTMHVQGAGVKIKQAILDAASDLDLTAIELARILQQEAMTWMTYALREERHPDDPEKKADEA